MLSMLCEASEFRELRAGFPRMANLFANLPRAIHNGVAIEAQLLRCNKLVLCCHGDVILERDHNILLLVMSKLVPDHIVLVLRRKRKALSI
jgi:hypothetical protein